MPSQKLLVRQPLARGEHEADDSVDGKEGEPGKDEIEPADDKMAAPLHAAEGLVVDEDGNDFREKEDPFDGPGEDKVVDEDGGGGRGDEGDGEPDAHPGHGAQHQGEEQEELGVLPGVVQDSLRAFPIALHLGEHEEEAAADGEMGDVHMEDGDEGDEQAAAGKIQLPDRIIHQRTSSGTRAASLSM